MNGMPYWSLPTLITFMLPLIPGRASAQDSRHFQVEELKQGIFAAVHKPGGHAICNAGFIDLGASVLVIDPFISPAAAFDLKETIAQRLNKPVSHVVYTHHHNDHIRGAQVFTDAVILSSQGTRGLIESEEPAARENERKHAAGSLEEWRSRQVTADDILGLREKAEWVDYYEAIVSSMDGISIEAPSLTFEGALQIHGALRTVEIRDLGAGHTPHDAIVWLPEDSVLFAGDLLFQGTHAWMSDGDPENWMKLLDGLALYPVNRFVPGHGPVCGREGIPSFKAYLQAVMDTAKRYKVQGTPPWQDPSLLPPKPFDTWSLRLFFKPNVFFAYKRLVQERH